jgi:hypothetical protein
MSIASKQTASSGVTVGGITFNQWDGSNLLNAASISVSVDGTPGANDMPGRLVFSTTADGASSPTERMRISNAGTTTLTSAASTAPFIANIGASEAARIDSSGRLLVGTSSTSTSHLLQVAGPTLTSWFACDTKSDADVPASTTSVLTISGSSSVMVKVYIQVYFSANTALNAFFDYDILTADTGGAGGGATIRQTLNESVGSFQVATGDFAVTRSANTVTITYTNQASGTNGIIWRVAGLFNSLSIA